MTTIATLLADPTNRGWYLAFCMAVMILPAIVASIWYHTNIGKTPGGRQLMQRHNANRKDLSVARDMARDISAGRYGTKARTMQNIIYRGLAVWVAANVVVFGILIWADEINRPIHEAAPPRLQR